LCKAHDELEMRVQEHTGEPSEMRDYRDNLFNYANAPHLGDRRSLLCNKIAIYYIHSNCLTQLIYH
jgi:hypothetical protein